MKKMKKMMAVLVAMVMTLAMGVTAFAQTKALDPADADNATITINNPAKGETYKIYKLFDATVVGGDKIAYQCEGDIPESLKAFFTKDGSNNVFPTDAIAIKDNEGNITGTNMTDDLKAALEDWADSGVATLEEVSNGEKLEFTGLPYGYYVVTTTHKSDAAEGEEAKSAITVTSTQPNAEIVDKNVNEPSVVKKVDKESYSIGDTVGYTATFDTTNYMTDETTKESSQVINYLIEDTLPEFLSNVEVKSIMIGETEYKLDDGSVPQFDSKKQIMIPWATKAEGEDEYTSLYAQGVQIVIRYEATLTSTTNINADDKNTISITPYVDNGGNTPGGDPWDESWKDDEVIKTYAAAINKVDDNNQPLAGAEFTIAGLVVKEVEGETGVYRVVSYDPASTTASATLVTDDEGKLYIVGLASDVKLIVTETKAPDGYNKLTETKELPAQILSTTIYETSGERHYDKDGNLVSEEVTGGTTTTVEKNLDQLDAEAVKIVNNQGSLLPSTGGIGTTIFYIVGAVLVVGAAVLLVTKKRMSKEA